MDPTPLRSLYLAYFGDEGWGEEVGEWLAESGLPLVKLASLWDVLDRPHEEVAAGAVLALCNRAPLPHELQLLLDLTEQGVPVICGLSASLPPETMSQLVDLGIYEVVPLFENPAAAVVQFILSSVKRDRVRRELARARERALVRRDVAAALAVASSRKEIIEAFARGMMALGALGVACWERSERGVRLALEVGESVDGPDLAEFPIDAAHPAALALGSSKERWFASLGEAMAAYPEWRVRAEQATAVAVIPILRGDRSDEVVLCGYARLPSEVDQRAAEQLAVQLGDTLRRAELQTTLAIERDVMRRLLSVVSHDLRNPINTVLIASKLLEDHADEEVSSLTRRIERAGHSASKLVDDLLTFVASATQGIALCRARTQVLTLALQAVADANLRARAGRRVVVEATLEDPWAEVDGHRIEQALGNLLSNALTYAPAHSEISVRLSGDPSAIYLDVENAGAKLAPSELVQIFQPLTRLSAAGERGSMGLGLYIVNKVLEAHGGRVWAEPGAQDGVRFCLQIPRVATERGAMPLVDEISRPSGPAPERELPRELAGLLGHISAESLRSVLSLWAQARRSDVLPHPLSLDRSRLLPYQPDLAWSTVHLDASRSPVFVWESVGARLERRMRGTLRGRSAVEAQYQAYARCYAQARPTYEFVRQRGPQPFSFERLLLPLARSRDGAPTDLLAAIHISDRP